MSVLMFSGWAWLVILIVVAAAGSTSFLQSGSYSGLFAALFGVIGSFLTVEHAIIMPEFYPTTFGALLEWGFLGALGVIQVCSNVIAILIYVVLRR